MRILINTGRIAIRKSLSFSRFLRELNFSLMARGVAQLIPRPWVLDLVPALVILLIAAHVLALVYWIYRLVLDGKNQRSKHS